MCVLSVGRAFEHEIAVRVDPAVPARRDQRRGVVLLDDGGAGEGIAAFSAARS